MITAKCNKCGGVALGSTFKEASAKINHAVALSRGIKCGDNYNMVHQIEDTTPKKQTQTVEKPKESTPTESKESPVEQKSKPTKSKSSK